MSIYKKKSDTLFGLSIVLCMTFLLQIVMTPLTYTQNLNPVNRKQYNPFSQYGEALIMKDLTGNELLTDVEIKQMVSRNLKDFQRLLRRVLYAAVLPILSDGILLIFALIYHRRLQKRGSLIASSLGGHAPPNWVLS